MDENLKILLCEDDENLGMLLREYLQAKGYTAELCPDGEAGYRAFMKTKFDICVLDVMMPKKDGFTLAQEIRQANAEIPIIFLTAKTSLGCEEYDRYLGVGLTYFLGECESVFLGHHHVENTYIKLCLHEGAVAGFAVWAQFGCIALGLQVFTQKHTEVFIVLAKQNFQIFVHSRIVLNCFFTVYFYQMSTLVLLDEADIRKFNP